jgi:hypothetical protein
VDKRVFHRRRIDADFLAEFDAHPAARVAGLIARGMAADAAWQQLRFEFRSVERYKEEVRGARGIGAIGRRRAPATVVARVGSRCDAVESGCLEADQLGTSIITR